MESASGEPRWPAFTRTPYSYPGSLFTVLEARSRRPFGPGTQFRMGRDGSCEYQLPQGAEFYRKLGFELLYGGDRAAFSSLKAGEAFVNLLASQRHEHNWWGRVIFRVDHVDAHYRALQGTRTKA